MTALILLLSNIASSIFSLLGWIGYWIILPLITYIVIRLLALAISFSNWRENRNYAPTRGCKRRNKWFE